MRRKVSAEPVQTTLPAEDSERAAIQAEAAPAAPSATPPAAPATPVRADVGALGAGFFGRGQTPFEAPPASPPASVTNIVQSVVRNDAPTPKAFVDLAIDGEEVVYVAAEEMYGKTGTFSSYRVGPITLKTRVRAGETHFAAYERLRAEGAKAMEAERAAKDAEFKGHFKTAFG